MGRHAALVRSHMSGHALSFEIASLGMPLKHRKQITLNEHNMVKNPNWLEAGQLAIYKA